MTAEWYDTHWVVFDAYGSAIGHITQPPGFDVWAWKETGGHACFWERELLEIARLVREANEGRLERD